MKDALSTDSVSLEGDSLQRNTPQASLTPRASLPPKNWCPLPWKGLLIKNTGELRVCIQSNQAESSAAILGENGLPLKIQNNEIEEFQNSSLLRSIRLSMLEDKEHPHCVRCNLEEKSGLTSARMNQRLLFQETFSFEESKAQTAEDGSIQPGETRLGFADLRLGNKCNLKCRMCGPSESSGWYEEHFYTVGSGFRMASEKVKLEAQGSRVGLREEFQFRWVDHDAAWERLDRALGNLKMLHMVGGEPFLEEKQISTLEKLVKSGRSKSIIIDYNSNLSVIPERLRALWKEFFQVRIGASIDGIQETHEYIRFPSKWKMVERNFLDLAASDENLLIWPTTTVQILNAYEFLHVYRWRLKNRLENKDWRLSVPLLKLHPVHNPEYYSIRTFPVEEKERLKEAYLNFIKIFTGEIQSSCAPIEVKEQWMKSVSEDIMGLIRFLFSKDSSSYLPEFWRRNNKMDEYRTQSFSSVYPELNSRLIGYVEKREASHGCSKTATI